jgi:CRISPR-associated helicase, Cyano-type
MSLERMSSESVVDNFVLELDGLRLESLDREYLRGIKPFEHQIETEQLIEDNECESLFLFNHSPTGSGKTLSWLKPVLDEKMRVIAIYPTNALVIDQEKQVNEKIRVHGYNSSDIHVQAITSDLLDEERELYSDEIGLRKGQLLNRVIRKGRGRGQILLTNPDILTLALKGAYYEHNVREATRSIDMIVVDEFHLASVKQSDMLLFMMHEVKDDKRSSLSKFVFLSATPNHRIVDRARRVGLNVKVLDDNSMPLSRSEGHSVLPKLNLEVRSGAIYKTYELIKEDLEYFVEFCKRPSFDGEKARTVFIVDGIYEVDEIFNALSEALSGFKVERVDGLHPATQDKLNNFEILVSNSSVEVGIDFDVDRLVFSGYSKSSLLQRIGRLRNKPPEETCDAICFVPEVVYDHLKGQNKYLTREELVQHLAKVMDSELDLSLYSGIYSPLEAYLYSSSRINGDVWRDKSGIEHHEKGMPESIQGEEWIRSLVLIEKHFLDREIDGQMLDYLKHESRKLRDGLLSYRGDSLQALMFDETDSQLKLYDLMYLLRRGDIEFMSPQRFTRRLRKRLGGDYEAHFKPRYEARKPFAAGFCWYRGAIEDPRRVIFGGETQSHYVNIMFNSADHARKPRMVSGFRVETEPNIPSLSYLNNVLSEFEIFARLVNQDGFSLKAKFRLGDFFYLYPYSGKRSISFGHNALYIDCLIKEEYVRRR